MSPVPAQAASEALTTATATAPAVAASAPGPEAFTSATGQVVLLVQSVPPSWVVYAAALLTPTLGALGLLVAYRQWRTARQKLDLDLFNRRFSVYDATIQAMTTVVKTGYITKPEVDTFTAATRGAQFLFDAELEKYLETVRERLDGIAEIKKGMEGRDMTMEEVKSHGSALHQRRVWVRDEWASKRVDAAFKKLKPLE